MRADHRDQDAAHGGANRRTAILQGSRRQRQAGRCRRHSTRPTPSTASTSRNFSRSSFG